MRKEVLGLEKHPGNQAKKVKEKIGEGNQDPLRESQAELKTTTFQDNRLMETREETA